MKQWRPTLGQLNKLKYLNKRKMEARKEIRLKKIKSIYGQFGLC